MAPSFPSIGITGWFDKVMRVIPTYYLSEALKLSMAGTVSSQLWMYLGVLAGCTVIVYFAAVWALHRRS
jgi:ABC-type multidrug transport system permease subunit